VDGAVCDGKLGSSNLLNSPGEGDWRLWPGFLLASNKMEVLYAVQETANLCSDKQIISLSVLKDVNSFGQLLADMELLVKRVLNEFSFWNVLGLQIILYALQCQVKIIVSHDLSGSYL
jgi:hypothetical protein